MSKETEPYLIASMSIKLADGLDELLGEDVPVLVSFVYHSDGDDHSMHEMRVKLAGASHFANADESATMTLADGFDISQYLPRKTDDKIEEDMLHRLWIRNQAAMAEEDAEVKLDRRVEAHQHRYYGW